MTWTKYSYETHGAYTEFEGVLQPGYNNPAHYHTLFAEYFPSNSGTMSIKLDGKEIKLEPDQSATVPIGHIHSLANNSEREIKYTSRLEPGDEGFEKAMYIMHGLANDGMSYSNGVPKNPVHLALVAAMMDTILDGWTFWLMRPLMVVLRRYAQGLGVEANLVEKYWNS